LPGIVRLVDVVPISFSEPSYPFLRALEKADGDGLLAAFRPDAPAAPAAPAAFTAHGCAALIAAHFLFDVAASAREYFRFPYLGHVNSPNLRYNNHLFAAKGGVARHGRQS
jgi:hypothetical protein